MAPSWASVLSATGPFWQLQDPSFLVVSMWMLCCRLWGRDKMRKATLPQLPHSLFLTIPSCQEILRGIVSSVNYNTEGEIPPKGMPNVNSSWVPYRHKFPVFKIVVSPFSPTETVLIRCRCGDAENSSDLPSRKDWCWLLGA